jgi:3-hydroxyacyl-CoA dehydrogenase
MNRFQVRKVAVLGAGVMGAQIAAHLVNVRGPGDPVRPAREGGPKNGIVLKAIENLKKLKPAPLGVAEDAVFIEAANYEEHLERLRDCDLVIEAIAERMDWKLDLYRKVAPAIAPHAIVASNTSGLSITKLSEVLPEEIKPRFCGIHFFNPPRYMALVELIATPTTEPRILDDLEAFVTSALGKSVVRAKDTPNFVANRVGIAGMLATMKEAETYGLTYDVVDDLTGKKLGRASSGTFRTADVVGLDTMAHVIKTLQDNLGPEQGNDPFFASFATPPVLQKLMAAGSLGQKTGAGFYKKVGKDIQRYDAATGDYVAGGGKADEIVARMLKKPPAERLKLLHDSKNPQAQFLWAILRDSFHYAAVHLADVAETARDVDFAMRWGSVPARVRSSSGSRPAGSRSRSGSRKTSTPARRSRRRRCRSGCSKGPSPTTAACTARKARGARPRTSSCRRATCRSICASRSATPSSVPMLPRRSRPEPKSSRTTKCASGRSTARC